jgi:hypothetical protein
MRVCVRVSFLCKGQWMSGSCLMSRVVYACLSILSLSLSLSLSRTRARACACLLILSLPRARALSHWAPWLVRRCVMPTVFFLARERE